MGLQVTGVTDGDECLPVCCTVAAVTALHDSMALREPNLPDATEAKRMGEWAGYSEARVLRLALGCSGNAVNRVIVNWADGGKPIWMQRHIRRQRGNLASYIPARLASHHIQTPVVTVVREWRGAGSMAPRWRPCNLVPRSFGLYDCWGKVPVSPVLRWVGWLPVYMRVKSPNSNVQGRAFPA